MSNKDDFKTTYSKTKGFHIIGYNADTDEYSKLHVDEDGHIYAKLLAAYGSDFVGVEADVDGNLHVNIREIEGDMGHVRISPMGALKTASALRLAGQSFSGGTVDPAFWTSTIVGTGAITQNYGQATLTTAATANSSILTNSVKIARYVVGISHYFRGHIQLPAVTTASAGFVNRRRWGAFDAANGFFFLATQTNPATTPTLSVVTRKTDGGGLADTAVASGSFNGNAGTTYALDTDVHAYEIWYSNSKAYFYVDDVLLHTVTSSATPASATLSLPVGLQTINSGDNTGANTLVARSASVNRLGVMATMPAYKNITGAAATTIVKYTAGYLHKVIFNNTTGTSVALWDGLTGAAPSIAIGKITTATAALGAWDFGVPFFTGLTIVTVGDNLDCTIVFE